MLKSCQYCGRIHDASIICEPKATAIAKRQARRSKDNERVARFRYSRAWHAKSKEIRQRDYFCCQICIRGLYDPARQYETDDLSVHHIEPIAEAWGKRLDNDNLITLCRKHHDMAEEGDIPSAKLIKIAREQSENESIPMSRRYPPG